MTSQKNSSTPQSPELRGLACRSWGVSMLPVLIALAVAFASPSICSAQTTLNLGQAGGYQLFVENDFVNISNSMISANVGIGANFSFGGSATTIQGAVYLDNDPTNYSSPGTVMGGTVTTNLSQAITDATKAASTAAGLNSTNANVLTLTGPSPTNGVYNGNYEVVGASTNGGENVINFSTLFNMSGGTITIQGTANEQFVFNFSQGFEISNTKVILEGVSASNVFFNIGGGGGVGLNNSAFSGTILDMSNTAMSIDNDSINGSIVTNGFADISSTSITPELPTFVMGCLACLLLTGKAGFDQLKRRRATRSALPQP